MTGTSGAPAGVRIWADALAAAALLAVDPVGLGGLSLRAAPGSVRDALLAHLRALLPARTPWRRLPSHIADDRLLGGLDFPATLAAGRLVAQRGLLAEADGGIVLAAMAERMPASLAARLTAALDAGAVAAERDGLALRHKARLALVALDEGAGEDEAVPTGLADRLALRLDLHEVRPREAVDDPGMNRERVAAARARLPCVEAPAEILEALCAAAATLGIVSLRAPLLALRAARAAAALAGRDAVAASDAGLAGRLVLGPRALQMPPSRPADPPGGEPPPPEAPDQDRRPSDPPADETAEPPGPSAALADQVLAAAAAMLPAALLAGFAAGSTRERQAAAGKAGEAQGSAKRGRAVGVRRGDLREGGRVNLLETLRAAAPWQALRRRGSSSAGGRLIVRPDDIRLIRFEHRRETATIFAVDASGSAALHRLAEAKGAVQLLLAECYVRRDQVALVAFRGQAAEILLPPTRSLARTRRALAALPGGGATPLTSGIDAATALAEAARRRGQTPLIVLLTDGRANMARDGSPGRPRAVEDALASARRLRLAAIRALIIDTSPHPRPEAAALAQAMGARYLPLPHADAGSLSAAIQAATPAR